MPTAWANPHVQTDGFLAGWAGLHGGQSMLHVWVGVNDKYRACVLGPSPVGSFIGRYVTWDLILR
jgi:hypothetical protein